eukprot:12918960-Prorocentrum_lima.AAC.1
MANSMCCAMARLRQASSDERHRRNRVGVFLPMRNYAWTSPRRVQRANAPRRSGGQDTFASCLVR